jgi:hypothetical protein
VNSSGGESNRRGGVTQVLMRSPGAAVGAASASPVYKILRLKMNTAEGTEVIRDNIFSSESSKYIYSLEKNKIENIYSSRLFILI